MNLLIEQRPTTITSSKSQQQQQSQISNENDMNNSSSSSPLVLKIKRHTTKQQQNNSISTSSHMSEEDNNSRSTPNTQRLKRTSLTNTTATRRPSSPAFNGKQQQQQQATKRSVTIDNNNNDLTGNIDDISGTKRFKRDDSNHSSSSKVDACVETVSIGLATEPDHLGPCEPGTSVVLEGIVWNETDSGVLVVNVTWRGKTYVGTLLDSTKQDWACPRLTCESPTSDYDARSSSKTSRTKRTGGAGGNTRCSNQQPQLQQQQQQLVSLTQQISSNNLSIGLDDRKLRNNIKSRQSKRLNNISTSINDETINNSSPLTSPYRTNNQQTFFSSESTTTNISSNLEPQLISCSESHCHKRFASNIALSYHLSDAHKKTDVIPPTIPQANTRDEEDVAHILANVADYVRRSSPPSSKRSSPEHHISSSNLKTIENSSLSWPCPQISSKLVLPSSLNNTERSLSPNSTRCKLNNNETTIVDNQNRIDQDDLKTSVKQADHFLLHIQDEVNVNKNSYPDIKVKKEQNIINTKIPTSPPPISSSPAYSDISDEDLTPNEQILPQPSTINLLAATNGKIDENGNNLHPSSSFLSTNNGLNNSNSSWTAQMLFQQFGSFIQPQTTVSNNKDLSTTPNRLNSNNNICGSSNGTSDSTVKNILDSRRSSATKSSSSPTATLYHYHTNETKFPTPIINTLTSPNENLLHLSSSTTTIKPMDLVDYSINNNRTTNGGQYHHSSSLHPSR
ncbi:unnamed protein product [Rotaria sp. Silwood2]|nr:unnamed protein product [Rotaria sp. Silwood2]CAF2510106.1 unnamed protein product [Rotaria sp. Silwood2]CAF2883623.1 unnamed protein product [Rotaria sp. Silwood2]